MRDADSGLPVLCFPPRQEPGPKSTEPSFGSRIGAGTHPGVRRMASWAPVMLGLMLTVAGLSVLGLLLQTRADNQTAIRMVDHTHEVIAAIDDLLVSADDTEVSQRAYLLTGDATYLPDFERHIAEVWQRYFRIRELTVDNPRQQASLVVLRGQLHDRLARMNRVRLLAQTGRSADVVAMVRTGVGRQQMNAIRLTAASMMAEERRLLAERRTVSARTESEVIQIEIGLGIVMATGFLLGLVVMALSMAADAATAEALETRRIELEERVVERTADLAAAEARFHGIFDGQFQFISLLSLDGTTLEMNRAALDAMLISRQQIIGRKFWETDNWPDAAHAQLRLDLATAASGSAVRREIEIRSVDGRPMWIDFSLKPVRDPQTGAAKWLIAESRDLTETRSLATQLAQAQKVQALGQLAGGIAHDFNNILQVVSGAAALIEQRPEDHAKTRRYARTALDAATRGLSITQRLLTFARGGGLRSQPIATATLLHDMHDILAHTLGSTIMVHVNIEGEVPSLVGDKAQLETVLINLGTNARDAMTEGGKLTLSARAEHFGSGSVHPASLAPGDYVRLDVTDDGVGMDASVLARVTEPFFTTKEQGKGTGLGLAMARGLAEQSGGALRITSTLGVGTTVTMWLRQATGEILGGEAVAEAGDGGRSREPALPLPPSSSASIAKRILLVDDDELVREIVAAQLEAQGFSTVVASSGAEALALLTAGEIVDAIVSDLSMPGMNGAVTIERVLLLRPRLPCILLTAYAGAATGLNQGQDFTLVRKPATGPELGAQLDALIEARAG